MQNRVERGTKDNKKARAWLSRQIRRFGLGVLVAITGLIVASRPFGQGWEEGLGLTWLFQLRGPIAPPDEVVILSIDRESSERFGSGLRGTER